MLQGWIVVTIALAYLGLLFAVASYGDRRRPAWMSGAGRPYIYALSLGVYCTSWTFFGSVGLSASRGLDFLTIYIGPIVMFALGWPLLLRIVRLAKAQNITSIADFIAARYGKSQMVAAILSIAAVIGTLPYIALQLKAISVSLETVLDSQSLAQAQMGGDLAMVVAMLLAAFAMLFGTRHVDATEHQQGLMLAVTAESLVKLVVFLCVGAYVVWVMFDGAGDLIARGWSEGKLQPFLEAPRADVWIAMIFLSLVCSILLPRQFHVTVVENHNEADLRRAAWLYPLYLVAINLFVVPITIAGLIMFPPGTLTPDMYVLGLPLSHGAGLITLLTFLGGLSAATAMVIVESVALAIMLSNDIAMPLLLRRGRERSDMGRLLLTIRRVAIFVILFLGYCYYRVAGDAALAQIGLLSFAAIAQFAPAFFGGLFWRRATARGAIAGLITGLIAWCYTLLLPSLVGSGMVSEAFVAGGAFGLPWLRPQALFGLTLDPLAHGVLWSLALNAFAYVAGSLARPPEPIERLQARAFAGGEQTLAQGFRPWRSRVSVGELTATVARYLGEERAGSLFAEFSRPGQPLDPATEADIHHMRLAEHALASAIGAASSRVVLSILLRQGNVSAKAALKLLDDASAGIQYSRDLLQTALDHAKQGITVIDRDLHLVCWNREFVDLFDLPPEQLRVGTGLDEIIQFNAERGLYGAGAPDEHIANRLERIVTRLETFRTRLHPSGRTIEIRSNRMPDGGTVTTYTDVSETVAAEEALEHRVRERTGELTRLNQELLQAKAAADEANISKTRFVAAASHDILQPLNAARLYVSSLVERAGDGHDAVLVRNADASLEAVEEILSALLDISRLDSGALKPDMSVFPLDEVFRQLAVEFAPLAQERALRLRFVPTSAMLRTDRGLLRRLLQNLISNAIKYTPRGSVLVGCRHSGGRVRIEVLDTGLGIAPDHQHTVFREFLRLEPGARVARGLGLGLSIVQRISRLLGGTVRLRSEPDRGSAFSIELPLARKIPRASRRDAGTLAPPPPVGPLADLRVLCLDNEPRILDGMTALLGNWGCAVLTAASAGEALDIVRRLGSVDIVLADYHLDHGDGLSAIAAIRTLAGAPLPAVLVTADRSLQLRDAARAAGVEVLTKPIRPAALRALLSKGRAAARPAAE